MKVLRKLAVGVFALSMGQVAFCGIVEGLVGDVLFTASSPFLTCTGFLASTSEAGRENAEKMELDEADVNAVREGTMTEHLSILVEKSHLSSGEAMAILQDAFGVEER